MILNNNIYSSSGFRTGECVSSIENGNKIVCEMNGWCPEELSNST